MPTKNKNKVKIILDITMALIFAVLFNKMVLGGLVFHEIAGIAIGTFIILHKVLNRAWLQGVTKKFFSAKLPVRTRVAYIIDILLLSAVLVIIVTGILMLKVLFAGILNVHLNVSGLHKSVSYIALMLIGVHIGLSWNRVVSIMKKLLKIQKKKALRAIATACALIVFAVGSYNIVSSGYVSKVASSVSGYSETGNGGASFSGTEPSASSSTIVAATTASAEAVSSASINTGSSQQATSGSSPSVTDESSLSNNNAEGNSESVATGKGLGNHGAMNGKDRAGSAGLLATLYQNLSIMAAFSVFTYYIDKLLHRKRKKGMPNVQKAE